MEHITDSIVYKYLEINGKQIPFITDAVLNMWVAMALIMVAVLVLTRKLSTKPGKRQLLAEAIVGGVDNMARQQLGNHAKPFVPYLGTVLIFIAVSNLLGLFNIIPQGGFWAKAFNNPALAGFSFEIGPPTRNFNVTVFLALLSMAVVIYAEFKYKGVKGWLRTFYKPTPISAFVKLLDYIVRPMSLCLRLFGNILGGYIVMTLLYMAMPLFVPALVGVYFDLFDGALQAYVFVFLTMLYLSEAVEQEEE